MSHRWKSMDFYWFCTFCWRPFAQWSRLNLWEPALSWATACFKVWASCFRRVVIFHSTYAQVQGLALAISEPWRWATSWLRVLPRRYTLRRCRAEQDPHWAWSIHWWQSTFASSRWWSYNWNDPRPDQTSTTPDHRQAAAQHFLRAAPGILSFRVRVWQGLSKSKEVLSS